MDVQLDSERARLIETLFSTAAGLTVQERAIFLHHACGKDTALRNEIESLLVADTVDDRFIDSVISDVAQHLAESGTGVSDEDMVGCLVGLYRVVDLIGKGGMGAVYHAVREDQFQMQVALKVIKRGADTHYAIKQFRNERQILARLEHPNIARLLDGGVTADGLPYFVMEFVEGQCITDYCRWAKLDITSRLQLFRSVVAAIQYAHQHLVVHRDLKPRNILITADGIPKLLDFGIAKLLAPPSESQQTAFSLTGAGVRVMTLD